MQHARAVLRIEHYGCGVVRLSERSVGSGAQQLEFIEGFPSWRWCGLLAFTVNLQRDGPTNGNYGENGSTQPHNNGGFDAEGGQKPACAKPLERVIAPADRLGMVVIVGFFYQGEDERISVSPNDRYARTAMVNGVRFLTSLPHRNVLIGINNETSVGGYSHSILLPDGVEAVWLAMRTNAGAIPVSMNWMGGIQPRAAAATRRSARSTTSCFTPIDGRRRNSELGTRGFEPARLLRYLEQARYFDAKIVRTVPHGTYGEPNLTEIEAWLRGLLPEHRALRASSSRSRITNGIPLLVSPPWWTV